MSDAVVPFEGIGRTDAIPELDLVIPKDLYEIMRDKEPTESETSSASRASERISAPRTVPRLKCILQSCLRCISET